MSLIDSDKLKERVLKWLPADRYDQKDYEIPFEENIVVSLMMEIEEMERDGYEVVYCKECKHWGFNKCPMYHEEYVSNDYGDYIESDIVVYDNTEENSFCYKGDRMRDGYYERNDE